MRRPAAVLSSLAVVAVAAAPSAATAVPAAGAVRKSCTTANPRLVDPQDVDGDAALPTPPERNTSDIVVGVPTFYGGAGAVELKIDNGGGYQRVSGSTFTGLPGRVTGDAFGSAATFLTADGDLCADLAIGAPGSSRGRGAVVVAHGSTSGLAATHAHRLVGRTAGEHLGAAVAAVRSDLFVAAPDRTVAGRARAGAIDHYRLTAGAPPVLLETITEDSPGVPGVAETGDRFGAVLATATDQHGVVAGGAWLVVGEPSEDAGSVRDAGSVTVLSFSARTHRLTLGRTVAQDAGSVPGVAETGDHFGAAVSASGRGGGFLVVGVPDEAVGSRRSAGQVQVFTGLTGAGPLATGRTVTQDSDGVPGTVEAGDRFGASVQTALLSPDAPCQGGTGPDVAVGSPGEDVGAVVDAGTVSVVATSGTGPVRPQCRAIYYQGSPLGMGTAERGDGFGAALGQRGEGFDPTAADPAGQPPAYLLIGVPGEDVGRRADVGWMNELRIPTHGTFAGSWVTRDPYVGQRFGSVFAQVAG